MADEAILNLNLHSRAHLLVLALLMAQTAFAQFSQSAPKIVGSGAVGGARQGTSVAISGDGGTVIVGGPADNNQIGAAWVFAQAGGSWGQQGRKLVDAATGLAYVGSSVAVSFDGNTAIVGGPAYNTQKGGAWVYARNGGAWSLQRMLSAADAGSDALYLGAAVALSADGNTALVGAPLSNGLFIGAAYVFVRAGSFWTRQAELVGSGTEGQTSQQGYAVALSADGNTALIGGSQDNSNQGAAWVFSRSGGTWTQQGSKLVDRSITGAGQGYSVALSADGSTAVLGGMAGVGAWVYVRSGGVWSQQSRLVAPGFADGGGVALSYDGNTALVGGSMPGSIGAVAWSRSGISWQRTGQVSYSSGFVTSCPTYSTALSADGRAAIVGNYCDGPVGGFSPGAAMIFGIPDLSISMTHAGGFRQGDAGSYSIAVSNIGNAPSVPGAIVDFVLPPSLTVTGLNGAGWACWLTCSRAAGDPLPAASSYPPITVTVNVAANAPLSVTGSANISTTADGDLSNNTVNDSTNIVQMPDLTISTTHAGNFVQGDTGKQYSITVRNAGYSSTSGGVTVIDTLPAGLTATALAGPGWSCTLPSFTVSSLRCDRNDPLAAGSSYPSITLTVSVASNAPAVLANAVSVSGGGEILTGNDYASDLTTVIPLVSVTVGTSPLPLRVSIDGIAYTAPQTLQWAAGSAHTIATTSPQSAGPNVPFLFDHWSDGGAISHSVTAPSAPATYTVFFNEQYLQQTVTFPAIPDKNLGDLPFSLVATASSGLPVRFSLVGGPAALSGSTITLTGPGTVSVQANQPGDQWYAAAPGVTRTFRVLSPGVLLTLTASPASGGSVTARPSAPGNLYSPGTPVEVQAQANPGFIFTGFSGALSGTASPQSLLIAQAAVVTANFASISTDPKDNVTFAALSGAPLPDNKTISLGGYSNVTPVIAVPASGGAWLSAELNPSGSPPELRLSLDTAVVAGLSTGVYASYVVLGTPPAQRVITVTLAMNTATISGVLDAAGYQSGGLASEGLFTIFGTNLAVQTRVADTLAPRSLGGTTVTITDSAGVARQATLRYVSQTQVNMLAPTGLALGAGTLTVENGVGGNGSVKLQIAAISPGLFSADQTGVGAAAAVVSWVRADGEVTTALAAVWDSSSGRWVANPIDVTPAAGQVYLSLYGTGIRGRSSLTGVTTTVGGIPVEVLFAGAQSQFAGLDQVNIILPPSLAGMGDAEIRVAVDGHVANPVSITLR